MTSCQAGSHCAAGSRTQRRQKPKHTSPQKRQKGEVEGLLLSASFFAEEATRTQGRGIQSGVCFAKGAEASSSKQDGFFS